MRTLTGNNISLSIVKFGANGVKPVHLHAHSAQAGARAYGRRSRAQAELTRAASPTARATPPLIPLLRAAPRRSGGGGTQQLHS